MMGWTGARCRHWWWGEQSWIGTEVDGMVGNTVALLVVGRVVGKQCVVLLGGR